MKTDSMNADLLDWLRERQQNCERLAALRSGDEAAGWREDGSYFERAVAATAGAQPAPAAPSDMVLFCPKCGHQHIDRPNHWSDRFDAPMGDEAPEDRAELDKAVAAYEAEWTNPPHKSHLCHSCNHIWRPADVPTNGVAATKTRGKNDSPLAAPAAQPADSARLAVVEAAIHQLCREFGAPQTARVLAAMDRARALVGPHPSPTARGTPVND